MNINIHHIMIAVGMIQAGHGQMIFNKESERPVRVDYRWITHNDQLVSIFQFPARYLTFYNRWQPRYVNPAPLPLLEQTNCRVPSSIRPGPCLFL